MKLRVTAVERVVVINLESSNFLNYSGFHWVPPPALSQLEIKTANLPQTFSHYKPLPRDFNRSIQK